ncbi:MAG: DUF1015 domain-containing protein [Clostridia bacterium]
MTAFKNNVGVKIPNILLPSKGVEYEKWACVACDQYTSEPEYWDATETIVGEAPSTLKLILPELYLGKPDEEERIAKIRSTMSYYLNSGILADMGVGVVLTKRIVNGRTRTGLVLALDLENYDYKKGATTLIRATEGTIVERIPPRLKIREAASLELPHIIILIDDPEKTVIEPIAAGVTEADKIYDFDLMQDGGMISGYIVKDETMLISIINAFTALTDKERCKKMYGDIPPLLFALGDGNHSFATAKANWEKIKSSIPEYERENHPARFALVEIENVHDDGIVFEPIHRVLFNVKPRKLLKALYGYMKERSEFVQIKLCSSIDGATDEIERYKSDDTHVITFMSKKMNGFFVVHSPEAGLEVGSLQNAIDEYLKTNSDAKIDYVHGLDVVKKLSQQDENMGFVLPPMDKGMLFPTVMKEGALPRKTFSMGEPNEKRYYMECRRIL